MGCPKMRVKFVRLTLVGGMAGSCSETGGDIIRELIERRKWLLKLSITDREK
jgi:hypothetical protein